MRAARLITETARAVHRGIQCHEYAKEWSWTPLRANERQTAPRFFERTGMAPDRAVAGCETF
jgi:hypothetical protein